MRFEGTTNYVATDDLRVAVNAAIALERPLLIKGEPGTGKTVLAVEVAKSLGLDLIEWHIKSTTKANQGLYEYDAVSRLRDGQMGEERAKDVKNYIKKGKLWEAFTAKKRPVLLIDEIDKADIEFPNDLLQELDRMEFFVYETNETVKAKVRPIVIITSNRTREIHDALKRRCLYHWIDYPSFEKEYGIVLAKVPGAPAQLARQVVAFVQELRREELYKVPGVAETLDWIKALVALDQHALTETLVYDTLGALLKYREDIQLAQRAAVKPILQRLPTLV